MRLELLVPQKMSSPMSNSVDFQMQLTGIRQNRGYPLADDAQEDLITIIIEAQLRKTYVSAYKICLRETQKKLVGVSDPMHPHRDATSRLQCTN